MRCSLTWCVATMEGRTVTWNRADDESRVVPGRLTPASQIRADRFIDLGATVHDLVTGQDIEIGPNTSPSESSPGLVFSWKAQPPCGSSSSASCASGSGTELAVLNLAAVQG